MSVKEKTFSCYQEETEHQKPQQNYHLMNQKIIRKINILKRQNNMQNGTQKSGIPKNNIYILHPQHYTYIHACSELTRSRTFFSLCRVAAKQNEASDSVRTLDRTKEALGNAPTIV